MSDVERLFEEFTREDREGGEADPLAYLARVQGADRAELEALIDGYLARAPRRPFDREAFEAAGARAAAEEIGRSLGGASGQWPALLPRLRHRARLRRADVVARLAAELGATEAQHAKVARYYHGMERGTLPAGGVSDRVLQALAKVVGTTAEALREAGRRAGGEATPEAAGTAFARVGAPDPEHVPAEEPARGGGDPDEPPDDIDAAFTSA
ncbi:MAG TPA: hypothetical protein VFN44_15655 [Solirubrobacteraceae bacterium]|nr:hypothetical protein [Solirubrobacteraceae bacterium]